MNGNRKPVARAATSGAVLEFTLAWPGAEQPMVMPTTHDPFSCCRPGGGSTHELVFDRRHDGQVFWVSGQMYDHVARVRLDGSADFFPMPAGSGPHGMTFDDDGRLWVTLEFAGEVVRLDTDGRIVETVDVKLYASGASQPINTHPHGLGLGPDGSLWFTGKLSNTVGRIDAERNVSHFGLATVGAVPIYITAGADGCMWCTELVGNAIARIDPSGEMHEYPIPTQACRPIAITPSPDGKAMWFSEEAGGKVGRIDLDGRIAEFPVPLVQRDAILAGLAFDDEGSLWVQQYVSPPPAPQSPLASDYLVRFGAELLNAQENDLTGIPISLFKAPSKGTVMHRITEGPDKAMWFSELGVNQLGRVIDCTTTCDTAANTP